LAGPFKVNGVPLKRVNQAYVIATSTKVDIAVLDVAKYSDGYFKREVTKKKKGESQFFEAEKEVRASPIQSPTEVLLSHLLASRFSSVHNTFCPFLVVVVQLL
jgi:ribosomal protein L14E/L6E/L27E